MPSVFFFLVLFCAKDIATHKQTIQFTHLLWSLFLLSIYNMTFNKAEVFVYVFASLSPVLKAVFVIQYEISINLLRM